MNILVMTARIRRVALLVALACAPRLVHAQEIQFVGLFEGHGIAHPKDPVLRRRALIAAQRLSLQCTAFYQVRGGGTGVESADCRDGELELARLGPAGAGAVLDVLDEPRVQGDVRGAPFGALIRALGNTGRAELVPVIFQALKRLDERESIDDPRVQEFGRLHIGSLQAALSALTYVTSLDLYALDKSRSPAGEVTGSDFETWYAVHGKESRLEWRRQAISRTLSLLKDTNTEALSGARCRLAGFPETAAAAVARLKAYVRRPECANWNCSPERNVLSNLEPWAKWAPPEWSPI